MICPRGFVVTPVAEGACDLSGLLATLWDFSRPFGNSWDLSESFASFQGVWWLFGELRDVQSSGHLRACLNSLRPCGTGRNGTRLFMAVRSVPRYKIVFGSIQNFEPRQPSQYEQQPFSHVHDTTACWCEKGVHSNKTLFVPVRSGRSVLLKKKKGPNTSSSSYT